MAAPVFRRRGGVFELLVFQQLLDQFARIVERFFDFLDAAAARGDFNSVLATSRKSPTASTFNSPQHFQVGQKLVG